MRALIAFILQMLGILWDAVVAVLVLITTGRLSEPSGKDCCIEPGTALRPRPDPYVYSQWWLYLRGIGFTWDNPDFVLLDAAGVAADRMNLIAGATYSVVIHVHNGSLFDALGTKAHLQVLEFGVAGVVTHDLGVVPVDVPAFGVTDAKFAWTTPVAGGHNCLRVDLSHPDDGNPLNNLGQHNTEVAKPASPTRKSTFVVRNDAVSARPLRLEWDSYRLPEQPMRPRSLEERNSFAYLRKLREANSRQRFPVSVALDARLTVAGGSAQPLGKGTPAVSVDLAAHAAVEVTFEATPVPGSSQVVNIHAFDDKTLVGGVTFYVDAEA